MRIEYDPNVDALYIRLRPAPEGGVGNRPISDEVIADYGPDGKLVGIEVLDASAVLGEGTEHVVVDVAPVVAGTCRRAQKRSTQEKVASRWLRAVPVGWAMASSEKRTLVFISRSGEDTWVARQIAREVESRGAQPFLDEADIDVGADFEEDIRAFLGKADELLVLMTPWSLQRPWVWAEIGAAWSRGIPIVVMLHGVSVSDFQAMSAVPVFLKKRDMIHLNSIDQYLDQLSARIAEGRGPQ